MFKGAPILVLSAMPSESRLIQNELRNCSEDKLSIFKYKRGTLGRHDIISTVTGVGVTNAAMCTALFVEKLKPKAVIVSGTGSRMHPRVNCGDVIISKRTIHHAAGNLTEKGMEYRKVRSPNVEKMTHYQYKPSKTLYNAAVAIAKNYKTAAIRVDQVSYQPKVYTGVVCASDLFGVNRARIDDIRAKLNPDLMEMESAAIAQVCNHLRYPHIVFRAGSNKTQVNPGRDYRKYGQLAAASAARWTIHFLKYYSD